MTYQVLARKCRPQRFSEIVGQEHITRTLQNAVSQDRLGHAYLFVGPRGIGKTTTARILAKALNCTNRQDTEPCCDCESCRQIAGGSSLDVMEIDGASHNRVEHVREIRDNVQYTPTQGKYKIYIIDEVHMLTSAAWNALLKTLEEPPAHVKFFFATTEPQKVLATIVSRCQRLDFKRLTVPQISERLADIAKQEGVDIEEKALNAIARAADGAMRDAQSIFDQIIAFCGKGDESTITEENVIDVFGLASSNELKTLALSIVGQDPQKAVEVIHNLAERGRDLERMFGDLIAFMRNIMIYQICAEPRKVLDISDTEMEDLDEISRQSEDNLVRGILANLLAEERRLRTTFNKRVYLEVALVKSMEAAASVQIDKVIADLKRLQQGNFGNGGKDDNNKSSENSGNKESTRREAPNQEVHETQTDNGSVQDNSHHTQSHEKPQEINESQDSKSESENTHTANRETHIEADSLSYTETPDNTDTGAGYGILKGNSAVAEKNAAAPEDSTSQSESRSTADEEPAVADNGEADEIRDIADEEENINSDKTTDPVELWHQIIEEIRKNPENQQLKIYMKEMKPLDFSDGGKLQIAYDEEFSQEHARFLTRSDHLRLINNALQRLTGRHDTEVIIKKWKEGVSNENSQPRRKATEEVKKRVQENPFVKLVQNLFNAELIDARG